MTELIEAAADGNPELLREAVWKEYEELKGRIEVRLLWESNAEVMD